MKARIYTIALLSVIAILVNAQPFSGKPIENAPIQSQQIMTTGTKYNGTVYEPFNNTTPSEQSVVGASYSPAKAPDGRRKIGNFDDVPEVGEQENTYPIGDAMLPLLLMAVVFCGAIYFRRKRAAQKS